MGEDLSGRRSLDLVNPPCPPVGEKAGLTPRVRGVSSGRKGLNGKVSKSEGKPARVRTVMTEKQLLTLK